VRVVRVLVAASVAVATLVVAAPDARGDGEADIAAARERANRAAAALSDAESRLGELEAQIAAEQSRLEQAEAALAGLRSTMQETAVATYIGAASEPDAELVTGPDLNTSIQAAALARLVTQGSADAVDQYRAISQDATAARAALDVSRAQQEETVAELEDRRAALNRELARLEEAERQRRAAEQARLAREQAAANARSGSGGGGRSQSAPSTPIASGSWICPVQGPVAFVDSWGAPRSGGRRHQGVDMMSPRGTPTVAPVSGRVTHRGNSIGGLSWHLYGDDGHYYYGTHLSAYANEGAGHVEAGTIIGYVGDTGNARGNPHLHFEIHPNGGAAVNPYPTVARYC
jgi:murein DD-endopeptidase MepM/ murein hydrolase activator NlpD